MMSGAIDLAVTLAKGGLPVLQPDDLTYHGLVAAQKTLNSAIYTTEKLEETAKFSQLLLGRKTAPLTVAQVADLPARFSAKT